MLETIKSAYSKALKRLLFLDYDGTLVPFHDLPSDAKIDEKTIRIIENLSLDPKNTIVIISGRKMSFLETQFQGLNVTLIAEHGYSIKQPGSSQIIANSLNMDWKGIFKEILMQFVLHVPGSFIEEKESSVTFHHRNVNNGIWIETSPRLLGKIKSALLTRPELEMLEGNGVIEIKMATYNKGVVAKDFSQKAIFDFILAAGDDVTDETLFLELNTIAETIKVGQGETLAKYRINEFSEFISFLSVLSGS
jgi:trehalose 6-phosphate synthase/phosphatase